MTVTVHRIMRLAEQKGVSATTLTTLINAYPGKIDKWRQGSLAPSYQELSALANFFNVSIEYLLGNIDDPSPHTSGSPQKQTAAEPPPKADSYICISDGSGGERRIPVPADRVDRLMRLLEAGFPELFE